MSLIGHIETAEPIALDPNRNDAAGLALSVFLPVLGLVCVQAIGGAAGVYAGGYPTLPFALPTSVANLLPILMFPLWGIARWAAFQNGARGRAASWWVVGLMGVMLAYPYVTLGLDGFLTNWLDLGVLILAVAATVRVATVSRSGLLCMMPPLLILAAAAIPGYVVVTGGWSPGLAITVGLVHPER